MQEIPKLVKDLGIARLTNAVYVGTMKFTLDQVQALLDGEHKDDVPEKLRRQWQDFAAAYEEVDDAYALTLRSAITDEIAALDGEGDQLVLAVKGIAEAAMRMDFDPERQQAATYFDEHWRKYKINPQENMLSEWSKVQQACQEATTDGQMEQAAKTISIHAAILRLASIAETIREKITERAATLPEFQQMKKARATMDPEYKLLILMLNAFAIATDRPGIYEDLIATLNNNIDYVKLHAVNKGSRPAENTSEA